MQAIDLTDDTTQVAEGAHVQDDTTEDESTTDEEAAIVDVAVALPAGAVVKYEEDAAREHEAEAERNEAAVYATEPWQRPYPPKVFSEIDTAIFKQLADAFAPGAANAAARQAALRAMRVPELKALGKAHEIELADVLEKADLERTLFDHGVSPGSAEAGELARVLDDIAECVGAISALDAESDRLRAKNALCVPFYTHEPHVSAARNEMARVQAQIEANVAQQRNTSRAARALDEVRDLALRAPAAAFEPLTTELSRLAEADAAEHTALTATRALLVQYEAAGGACAAKAAELTAWHVARRETLRAALATAARALPAVLGRLVAALVARKAEVAAEQAGAAREHAELNEKVRNRARDGLFSASDNKALAEGAARLAETTRLLNELDDKQSDALRTLEEKLDDTCLAMIGTCAAATELRSAFGPIDLGMLPAVESFVNKHVLGALPSPPSSPSSPPPEKDEADEPTTGPPTKRQRRVDYFTETLSGLFGRARDPRAQVLV